MGESVNERPGFAVAGGVCGRNAVGKPTGGGADVFGNAGQGEEGFVVGDECRGGDGVRSFPAKKKQRCV